MMDALEAIQTRRSVRKYEKSEITDEIVEKLLSAAMSAPSAVNQQPWEFIVIKDREMLDAIPTFSKFARMAAYAPLGILVCGDTRNLISPGFWVQDSLQLRRTF
jgi:nitroreductase